MRISCHLSFDGDCEAAFIAYQRLLGGEIRTLLRYGDSPMASDVPPEWQARVLHATLIVGDQELVGADAFPNAYAKPQGFSVLLCFEEFTQARDVFTALSEGGKIQMPFEPTFWSTGFGVVIDRFGVCWEVQCEQDGNPG